MASVAQRIVSHTVSRRTRGPIAVESLLGIPGAPVHVIERTENATPTPMLARIAALATTVLRLALASPQISVVIARADLGLAGDVRGVPALKIDGELLQTGPISEYSLAQRISARA